MPKLLTFKWFHPKNGCICLEASSSDILETYDEEIETTNGSFFVARAVLKDNAKIGTRRLIEEAEIQWYTLIMDEEGLRPKEKNLYLFQEHGPLEDYFPFEDFPGLFMEFSELTKSVHSITRFASKYGFLEDTKGPENLRLWFSFINTMKKAIKSWKESKKLGDFTSLTKAFNLKRTNLSVMLEPRSDKRSAILSLRPNTLKQAIWLQFAQAVSIDQNLRKCVNCPTWFSYGTGTGRRKSAHFCSDACRKDSWLKGKKK